MSTATQTYGRRADEQDRIARMRRYAAEDDATIDGIAERLGISRSSLIATAKAQKIKLPSKSAW